jgi:hypothetical protein
MKFSQYDPQVNPNTIQGQVRRPGDLNSYGGNGDGYEAIGRGLGAVNEVTMKMIEEDDKRSLLEAVDKYNKARYNILYNNETGLMNTRLEGAVGAQDRYLEEERKIRSEILGQTKFVTSQYRSAFEEMANRSANQGWALVGQHQHQQGEKVKDVSYENNINDQIEFGQKNYDNNDIVVGNEASIRLLTSARYQGYGEAFIKNKTSQALGKYGSTLITAAIVNQNYAKADELLGYFYDDLTPEQRNGFNNTIFQKEKVETIDSFARQIFQQFGNDEEGARAFIDNMGNTSIDEQQPGNGITWVKKEGASLEGTQYVTRSGLADLGQYYQKMTGEPLLVTSGTDSGNLHAEGERSHGGGWKVDVASDWLENPENRAKFIQYAESKGILVLDEYSEPSTNSTSGHLDLDFTDYKGSGGGRRLIDYGDKETVFKMYKNMVKDQENRQKEQQNAFYAQTIENIYNLYKQGVPYQSVVDQIKAVAGANVEAGKKMLSAADYFYDSDGKIKGLSSTQLDVAQDMLGGGMFTSLEEYTGFLANHGAKPEQLYKAKETWDQFENSEGRFSYNWSDLQQDVVGDIKDKNGAKAQAWREAQAYGKVFISKFILENKREPMYHEVVEACRNSLKENHFGTMTVRGSYLNSEKEVNISDARLALVGIRNVERARNTDGSLTEDLFIVRYTDGRVEQMNAAKLYIIAG